MSEGHIFNQYLLEKASKDLLVQTLDHLIVSVEKDLIVSVEKARDLARELERARVALQQVKETNP